MIDQAGRTLAREVMQVVESNLAEVEPALRSALVEVPLKLAAPPSRAKRSVNWACTSSGVSATG